MGHGVAVTEEDSVMRSAMIVGLGADDAGVELKNRLARELSGLPGITVRDFGVASADDAEPYPQVGLRVAEAVARRELDRAILVCGTGIGMAITANKVPGVRATIAYDAYSVERSVLSNNCQVLALGARVIAAHLASAIARQWLSISFDESSPSAAKLAVLSAYENGEHQLSGYAGHHGSAC